MPPSTRKHWTTWQQWKGNLVPLLIAGPFLALGLASFFTTGLNVRTYALIAAFPVVAWVGVGLCGLIGNGALRQAVGALLHRERPFDKTERMFVGVARPSYRSSLDPHEDVGFLVFHDDRLEFFGETLRVTLDKDQVTSVGFRRNMHSWVGLGGWVSIEATDEGKPVRLLVEPRERGTLFGNRGLRRRLRDRIEAWCGA